MFKGTVYFLCQVYFFNQLKCNKHYGKNTEITQADINDKMPREASPLVSTPPNLDAAGLFLRGCTLIHCA